MKGILAALAGVLNGYGGRLLFVLQELLDRKTNVTRNLPQ
jgi:hypothetical protein